MLQLNRTILISTFARYIKGIEMFIREQCKFVHCKMCIKSNKSVFQIDKTISIGSDYFYSSRIFISIYIYIYTYTYTVYIGYERILY